MKELNDKVYNDLMDFMTDVLEVLEDYSDAEYVDGVPRGNKAMVLLRSGEVLYDKLETLEVKL